MTTTLEYGAVRAGVLEKLAHYNTLSRRSTLILGKSRHRITAEDADKTKMAAIEAGQFYQDELADERKTLVNMPASEILAADNTDANLGTLSGTLALQATLPLFKYRYPVLAALYSDFSAEPGLLNQAEMTRIIINPATQTYDTTLDATGRPKGWSNVIPAQTIDVPITLDTYIGVPIVFSAVQLASTMRKLFDEQAPAAVYAIGKYLVNKVSALFTPGNFNAYANVNGALVPTAYATYAVALKDFSMDAIDDLEAIFDANEVPPDSRTVLLNAQYHGKVRKDPRLSLFFAAMQKPEIVTEGKLPPLNGFIPIRAPWLPVTNNLAGFALHKAGIVIKQRLPADWSKVLDVLIPGSVTTIADPETGLSVSLVQYINLQQGYAEWRVESLLGAGPGDKRGGLCIIGQ